MKSDCFPGGFAAIGNLQTVIVPRKVPFTSLLIKASQLPAFFLLLFFLMQPVWADTPITPTGDPGTCWAITDDTTTLYKFSPDTASPQPPTAIPISRTNNGEGLAWRPSTNELYLWDGTTTYVLNADTGADVRSFTADLSPGTYVEGATFYVNPATLQEELWLTVEDYVSGIKRNDRYLIRIDPDTGAGISSAGPMAGGYIDPNVDYGKDTGGLAIDPASKQFWVTNDGLQRGLYPMDDSTAAVGSGTLFNPSVLDGETLAFANDGYLYTESDEGPSNDRYIWRIDDVSTGAVTRAAGPFPGSGDVEGMACDAGASLFLLDRDSDGINDDVDIDDDNDGVTDAEEGLYCPAAIAIELGVDGSFEDLAGIAGSNAYNSNVTAGGWVNGRGSADSWVSPTPTTGSGTWGGIADGTPSSPNGGVFVGGWTTLNGTPGTNSGESFYTDLTGLTPNQAYTVKFYQTHAGIEGTTPIGGLARWAVSLGAELKLSPDVSYLGEGNQVWEEVSLIFTPVSADLRLEFMADDGTDGMATASTYDYPAMDHIEIYQGDLSQGQDCTSLDTDNDGIANHLDLDSDGDGIPDNIEAQSTSEFTPPPAWADADNDGLHDIYDANDASADEILSAGLIPINTDAADNVDMLDTDTDNAQGTDTVEAGITLANADADNDGLDDAVDTDDADFGPPDAGITNVYTAYPNDDVNKPLWRSLSGDTDGDGVYDGADQDSDNDGLSDTLECGYDYAAMWLYNGAPQSVDPNAGINGYLDANYIASASPAITGAGLVSTLGGWPTQAMRLSGVNAGTYAEAVTQDEYVEFQFTTVNYSNKIYLAQFAQWIDTTLGSVDGELYYPYNFSVVMAEDAAFTNPVNVLNETASAPDEFYSQVAYDTLTKQNTLEIKPATTYYFRVYVYNPPASGELVLDDVSFVLTRPTCDIDGDGIVNHFDLDSDNDGIPDNIEAQSTTAYIAPNGTTNAEGFDTAYPTGLNALDTDGAATDGDGTQTLPDFLDVDSDNDSTADTTEAGLTLNGVVGSNGLDSAVEAADDYSDVNGSFDNTQTDNFPDADGDIAVGGEPDYRDAVFNPPDSDNDGLLDSQEALIGTDPEDADSDNDGISDGDEIKGPDGDIATLEDNTLPLDADTDDDGLSDGEELAGPDGNPATTADNTNPQVADSDADGVQDGTELGKTTPVASGSSDGSSQVAYTGTDVGTFIVDAHPASQTDPNDPDSDDGGACDGNNAVAGICVAGEDSNNNGAVDAGESNPVTGNGADDPIDTDNDGLTDPEEAVLGTDPEDADTDDDGLSDGEELAGPDGDSATTADNTDPLDADSDNDGLSDGEELAGPDGDSATTADNTDPLDADSDDDGLSDGEELAGPDDNPATTADNTNPNNADSDADGVQDGTELGKTTPVASGSSDGPSQVAYTGTDVGTFIVDAHPASQTDPNDPDSDDGGACDGNNAVAGICVAGEDSNNNGAVDTGESNPVTGNGADDPIDTDNDGLTDPEEAVLGTDPEDADTDGDGINDGAEQNGPDGDSATTADNTDPLDADSDDDGLSDGEELAGPDGNPATTADNTNPNDADSDADGVQDGTELGKIVPLVPGSSGGSTPVIFTGTNPATFVADADPLTTTDPNDPDTDDGGACDGSLAVDSICVAGEDSDNDGRVDAGETDPGQATDDQLGIQLQLKVLLQGPYNPDAGLMSDDLRTRDLLPMAHPYTEAPFSYVGVELLNAGVKAVTGDDAVVDWVLVELRDATDATLVLASKAMMVQRDGDVITADTGEATWTPDGLDEGNYYVAIRHRNHLDLITANTVALSSTPTLVDFSSSALSISGNATRIGSGGVELMIAGDANQDQKDIANGPGQDTNVVFSNVLSFVSNTDLNANYIVPGYSNSDLNLDGNSIFAGPDNDTNILLGNVLLHAGNSIFAANYIINGSMTTSNIPR